MSSNNCFGVHGLPQWRNLSTTATRLRHHYPTEADTDCVCRRPLSCFRIELCPFPNQRIQWVDLWWATHFELIAINQPYATQVWATQSNLLYCEKLLLFQNQQATRSTFVSAWTTSNENGSTSTGTSAWLMCINSICSVASLRKPVSYCLMCVNTT